MINTWLLQLHALVSSMRPIPLRKFWPKLADYLYEQPVYIAKPRISFVAFSPISQWDWRSFRPHVPSELLIYHYSWYMDPCKQDFLSLYWPSESISFHRNSSQPNLNLGSSHSFEHLQSSFGISGRAGSVLFFFSIPSVCTAEVPVCLEISLTYNHEHLMLRCSESSKILAGILKLCSF